MVPTLRNLSRIAMVFSKDLSYFFETEPRALFQIHRRKERVRLPQTGVDSPAYFFESLGYMVPDRHMDPFFAPASSFCMCWRGSWRFTTAISSASWGGEMRCTSTRTRRIPTSARAKSRPKRSS